MSTKSRQVTYGSRIEGAEISAKHARKVATEAAREADKPGQSAWRATVDRRSRRRRLRNASMAVSLG